MLVSKANNSKKGVTMKRLAPAVVLGCLAVNAAWAEGDSKPPPYVAVMGSYLLPDSVRQDTKGFGAHLVYGIPLTQSFSIEVNGFGTSLIQARRNTVHGQDASSDGQLGLGADANYHFGSFGADGRVVPFLLAGLGAEWETYHYTQNEFHWGPFIDIGAGVVGKLTRHLSLRGEARYYGIYNSESYSPSVLGDLRVNLGVQYAFFKDPPPPSPPPPPQPCNCEAPPPPPKPKCPPAPAGFKVDENGCVIEQSLVLRSVNFQFDKDQLTPAARDSLKPIASSLVAQPELYVEIGGHTDSVGSDAYNQKLSQERAQSVRSYLIEQGAKADHLTAKGYGESKPIASNSTKEGRAENRRVEFKVLNAPPAVTIIKKGSTEASKAEAAHGEPPIVNNEKTAPEKAAPTARKGAKPKP